MAYNLEYLNNAILCLQEDKKVELDNSNYHIRPVSAQEREELKFKRIKSVPQAFQVAGLRAYNEEPYTERQLPPPERKILPPVPLRYKGINIFFNFNTPTGCLPYNALTITLKL